MRTYTASFCKADVTVTRRIPPYSTFKIYDAMMGLEAGVISPEQSRIRWDGNALATGTGS